jgi:hypothetical protein
VISYRGQLYQYFSAGFDIEYHLHLAVMCYNNQVSSLSRIRSKDMKKISTFLTMLAASVLLSALPTFSSSGPFGISGPADYTDSGKEVETHSMANVGGTGPYGAVGFFGAEPGVVSKHLATPGGSGPYGAFASYGMIPGSGSMSVDNKNGCILVAKNCLPER